MIKEEQILLLNRLFWKKRKKTNLGDEVGVTVSNFCAHYAF